MGVPAGLSGVGANPGGLPVLGQTCTLAVMSTSLQVFSR